MSADYLLSHYQKWEISVAISDDLEDAILDFKRLIYDGSMLKGYTVTEREVLKSTLVPKIVEMQRAIFLAALHADLNMDEIIGLVKEGL